MTAEGVFLVNEDHDSHGLRKIAIKSRIKKFFWRNLHNSIDKMATDGYTGCVTERRIRIVKSVDSTYVHTIEGNYSDSVKQREIKIASKEIKGYFRPF
jgi:hypothetical protein